MTCCITNFILNRASLGPPKQVLKRRTSVLQSKPRLPIILLAIGWSLQLETQAVVALVQPPTQLSSDPESAKRLGRTLMAERPTFGCPLLGTCLPASGT